MSIGEIGWNEASFLHERLEHKKAQEVRWKLRFHREAENFHGNGLSDSAVRIGQCLGATFQVLVDRGFETAPSSKSGGNEFVTFFIANVRVGMCLFEKGKGLGLIEPIGRIRVVRVADNLDLLG
jgi:hypothetical protein